MYQISISLLKRGLSALSVLGVMLTPSVSHAFQDENSGCRILLCLANPNGPMSVSECKPDIKDFYRAISKGRPYPSCSGNSKKGDPSHFELAHDNYALCPAGTTDSRKERILMGAYVATPSFSTGLVSPAFGIQRSRVNTKPTSSRVDPKDVRYNNPTRTGGGYFSDDGGAGRTALACVGKSLGTTKVCLAGPDACVDSDNLTTVHVFDKIVYRKYNPNSFVANVYVKDKATNQENLLQRVRLFGQSAEDVGGVVEQANAP